MRRALLLQCAVGFGLCVAAAGCLAQDSCRPAVQLPPELAREEADRAARSPQVAPDLHLDPTDAALALDIFEGKPQLAVLAQAAGELNRETAHNIIRERINPMSAPHRLTVLQGETARVQLHTGMPQFFLRMDDDTEQVTHGGTFHVDTESSADRQIERPNPNATYLIERLDVRTDARVVNTFHIADLGSGREQREVIETTRTAMPGGHWLKVVPQRSLVPGEYALIEITGRDEVNTALWDFGVNPSAGPNAEVIVPQVRRPPSLHPRLPSPR